VRQESHRIRDGVRELTRSLGREPTQTEIQQQLGVSGEEYQDYLRAQNAEALASFDDLLHELEDQRASDDSPEARLVARRSIEQALHRLDEREQRVVQLYYEFELSLIEIAAVLDLTEARVCQINKAALKKMRDALSEGTDEGLGAADNGRSAQRPRGVRRQQAAGRAE
jgi:RNA polymerase sigma factor for flagellar operon FliA